MTASSGRSSAGRHSRGFSRSALLTTVRPGVSMVALPLIRLGRRRVSIRRAALSFTTHHQRTETLGLSQPRSITVQSPASQGLAGDMRADRTAKSGGSFFRRFALLNRLMLDGFFALLFLRGISRLPSARIWEWRARLNAMDKRAKVCVYLSVPGCKQNPHCPLPLCFRRHFRRLSRGGG